MPLSKILRNMVPWKRMMEKGLLLEVPLRQLFTTVELITPYLMVAQDLSSKNTWKCVSLYFLVINHCKYSFYMILLLSSTLIVIQYGFITMFVPAFPIAPLFALFNNMFELRTDAKKFLRIMRRPVIKRDNGIGIWFNILHVVSSLAIRTNVCEILLFSRRLFKLNLLSMCRPV